VAAIEMTGRNKLVMAGLWTDFCVVQSVTEALDRGYEVFVVTDACGDLSPQAHDLAIRRMVQAGAVPTTWLRIFLEFNSDSERKGQYDASLIPAEGQEGPFRPEVRYPYRTLKSRSVKKMTKRV
jgi:hypothetical protein